MIPHDSLTEAQRKNYRNALRDSKRFLSHRIRWLNADDEVMEAATLNTNDIVAGSVDWDLDGDVSRQLSLRFIDEARSIQVAPTDSPVTAPVYPGTQIQFDYGIWVPEVTDYVMVPVFRGPVTTFSRSGEEVSVTAQGRETFALAPFLHNKSRQFRRDKLSNVIHVCMGDQGETRFGFPANDSTSPKLRGRSQVPVDIPVWPVMRQWASWKQRLIFFDGEGRLQMRRSQENGPYIWTFGETDLVDPVNIRAELLAFRNRCAVYYTVGTNNRTHRVVKTIEGHPISPSNLRRNGERMGMSTILTMSAEKHPRSKAAKVATEELKRRGHNPFSLDFQILPVPHISEYDWMRLVDDGGEQWDFRFRQGSMELGPSGTMNISVSIEGLAGHTV